MKKIVNRILLITALSFTMCACTDDTIMVSAGDYSDAKGSGNDPDANLVVKTIAPLANPDRGYHLEAAFMAHDLTNPLSVGEVLGDDFLDRREKEFKSVDGSTKVIQQYIYLTGYARKDLDQKAFDNIQKIFDGLKKKGYKAILRFAYNWWGDNEYNTNWRNEEEAEEWVYKHIEQLKPILKENIGLIAAMQAGFLGQWGEWHNTSLLLNDPVVAQRAKNGTVNRLLDALPEPYNIEIRYPHDKNSLTLTNEAFRTTRLGFSNDFFTAGEHPLAGGNDYVPGTADYTQVLNESPNLYISGEIPYPSSSEWGLTSLISRTGTIRILRDHHYSAFDITQNEAVNLQSWRDNAITPTELTANNILFDESYFMEDGKKVLRSFFEFVRDHLGYRINVKKVELTAEGGNLNYNVDLTNTGFATVLNPRDVYIVLISESGEVAKEVKLTGVNPKDWQPYDVATKKYVPVTYTLKGTTSVTGLTGKYKVGIWMPEVADDLKYNGKYAVKFAISDLMTPWNDTAGKYAVNIIGEASF